MKKTIQLLTTLLLILAPLAMQAEDLKFTVQAPGTVVQGAQFELSYTINTQKVKDFRIGEIADFDVLMGPSRSSEISIINGTKSSSITYTYILRARKEGTAPFLLPPSLLTARQWSRRV